jgi:hypothetical protein
MRELGEVLVCTGWGLFFTVASIEIASSGFPGATLLALMTIGIYCYYVANAALEYLTKKLK